MEFHMFLGEEVATCTYPGLGIQFISPFLRLTKDSGEISSLLLRLASQRKVWRFNHRMNVAPELAPPRDDGPAKPPTDEQKRRLGWLWSGV